MLMPTSINVEMPHGISQKVDKIFISVTSVAPGICRYCKVTVPAATFPGLSNLAHPLLPQGFHGNNRGQETSRGDVTGCAAGGQ